MPRKFSGERLLVATHNPGKVREIGDLLAPFDLELVSAADLGLLEPEETGTTFQENAELKARAGAMASGLTALADDSGLVVPALGGDPGIYSARWAGPDKDFAVAMARVIEELDDQSREASFVSALTLAWPDGHVETFEGCVTGRLVWPARGEQGFGYDPIFLPDGHNITFGEMEPARKHAMSHRADAFRKMIAGCFGD